MIPRANVTAWRAAAPWPSDAQVEQDLVWSRALVELYSRPAVAGALAFRGGTAWYKLPGEAGAQTARCPRSCPWRDLPREREK